MNLITFFFYFFVASISAASTALKNEEAAKTEAFIIKCCLDPVLSPKVENYGIGHHTDETRMEAFIVDCCLDPAFTPDFEIHIAGKSPSGKHDKVFCLLREGISLSKSPNSINSIAFSPVKPIDQISQKKSPSRIFSRFSSESAQNSPVYNTTSSLSKSDSTVLTGTPKLVRKIFTKNTTLPPNYRNNACFYQYNSFRLYYGQPFHFGRFISFVQELKNLPDIFLKQFLPVRNSSFVLVPSATESIHSVSRSSHGGSSVQVKFFSSEFAHKIKILSKILEDSIIYSSIRAIFLQCNVDMTTLKIIFNDNYISTIFYVANGLKPFIGSEISAGCHYH